MFELLALMADTFFKEINIRRNPKFQKRNKKNPHERIITELGYPPEYLGPKSPEEQATILREQYQFPLQPLAKVAHKNIPKGAEGLWVLPTFQSISPNIQDPTLSHHFALKFVLERILSSRPLWDWSEIKLERGLEFLRPTKLMMERWEQFLKIEDKTPVVPAQFGLGHQGESPDYARYEIARNPREIPFSSFHAFTMLLTHPERLVGPTESEIGICCPGEECCDPLDGKNFNKSSVIWFDAGYLRTWYHFSSIAGRTGSVSGFLFQE